LACPTGRGGREFGEVAVRGEGVDVSGVERWDGYRSSPEDEVLGVFADLGRRKYVARLLADLMEAADV
jgi:hypothetical protein